jgi:iron complex transport system ATP-binding protein
MSETIEAQGLSVTLEGRRVLEAVDFDAKRGEVIAIVGPNGAGKSTLLRALAGLLPYRGTIRVDGRDGAALSPRERARLIAFVPQQTQLRAPMPVRDVVALGRYAHGGGSAGLTSNDVAAIERALTTMQVGELAERAFSELSGGEQRRVLVARSLATEARVLLLDEPMASLDVRHALSLYRLLREQAGKGVAVVMVLHPLADALRFADRVVLLDAGRVVAAGAPTDVITVKNVEAVYGVRLIANATPGFELR